MKAVIVNGRNEFQVEEIEVLPPQASEVRVQMKACGICMSDHHVISGTMPTRYPLR